MRFDQLAVKLKLFRALRAAALALLAAVVLATPAAAEPAFSQTDSISVSPGGEIRVPVRDVFADSGTNPVFNSFTFSTTAYIDSSLTGFASGTSGAVSGADTGDVLIVTVLTNDELNALDPRPDSPFTFTADVTMTNDESQTASGTLTFKTAYDRASTSEPSQPDEPVEPTISGAHVRHAPVSALVSASADTAFDNAGTKPSSPPRSTTTFTGYTRAGFLCGPRPRRN